MHLFNLVGVSWKVSVLVDVNVENCVRSARCLVHFLAGNLSELHASIDDIDGLLYVLDGNFNQVLDKDFSVILFSD